MKRKQLTFFTYIIGLSTLHFNQLLLLSERVTRSSNSFLAETFQPTSNIPRGNLSAWCSNKNGYEHKLWFLNSCHCGKGSTYVTVNGKCVADSVITKGKVVHSFYSCNVDTEILITTHTFCFLLTLSFFLKRKFMCPKRNSHFLRVPAKKLSQTKTNLKSDNSCFEKNTHIIIILISKARPSSRTAIS